MAEVGFKGETFITMRFQGTDDVTEFPAGPHFSPKFYITGGNCDLLLSDADLLVA